MDIALWQCHLREWIARGCRKFAEEVKEDGGRGRGRGRGAAKGSEGDIMSGQVLASLINPLSSMGSDQADIDIKKLGKVSRGSNRGRTRRPRASRANRLQGTRELGHSTSPLLKPAMSYSPLAGHNQPYYQGEQTPSADSGHWQNAGSWAGNYTMSNASPQNSGYSGAPQAANHSLDPNLSTHSYIQSPANIYMSGASTSSLPSIAPASANTYAIDFSNTQSSPLLSEDFVVRRSEYPPNFEQARLDFQHATSQARARSRQSSEQSELESEDDQPEDEQEYDSDLLSSDEDMQLNE